MSYDFLFINAVFTSFQPKTMTSQCVLGSGLDFLACLIIHVLREVYRQMDGQTYRWMNDRQSEKGFGFQQWAKKQDLNIIIPKHHRKNSYFGIKAGNVPYNKEIELRWKRETFTCSNLWPNGQDGFQDTVHHRQSGNGGVDSQV